MISLEVFFEHITTLILSAEGSLLKPGAFVLGWTEEQIRLPYPSRLAARVEGRSSLARLGVGVHVTAPTIHAGFGFLNDPQHIGTRIRLEIWNCGPLHVCLEKGMKICQLILEEVHGTPEKGYEGLFATQAPQADSLAPDDCETNSAEAEALSLLIRVELVIHRNEEDFVPIMLNTILVEAGLPLADVRLLRHKDNRCREGTVSIRIVA